MQVKQTQSRAHGFRRTLLAAAVSFALAGAGGYAMAEDRAGYDDQAAMEDQAAQDQAMVQEDQAMMEEDTAAIGEMDEQEAEQLIGQDLESQQGETLGQIQGVVRDEQDQLALVVQEEGGDMLGLGGGAERVVPLDQVEQTDTGAVLTTPDEDLAQMEEFQEDQYETVAMNGEVEETAEVEEDTAWGDETETQMETETQDFGEQPAG
ncbi:hypothetical protein CAI21_15265 [Alkalilimnicola ehrlichii]|uniref:PRC-barrel domain-containing protein n=1 Tax=Alkalilimnicola ehrlichii TaxID=351052 RepID=A0A3E0WTT9_9GAMM|nr:PRC-barrel domain-containing protein [Alkalilimnicola ehrlichii]RFA27205.1 hypothetical protein CAI21_15265 [Alkalilimnicola ehrlichii]RFA35377.1 hypothetical protein CAL65_12925 [Alkalilimnicola ehrlichii]